MMMSIIRRNNDALTVFRGQSLAAISEPSCHRSMCLRAAQLLVGSLKCTIGMYEIGSVHVLEKPDAIGFMAGGTSILIECKMSRSDFLADKKKPHRNDGGIGDKRFFFTPPGLIEADELPQGWGLIETRKTSVRRMVDSADFKADKDCEQRILIAMLAIEQKIIDKLVTEHLLTTNNPLPISAT